MWMSPIVYYHSDLTGHYRFIVREEQEKRGFIEEKLIRVKTLPLPELGAHAWRASFHFPAWQKLGVQWQKLCLVLVNSKMFKSTFWLQPDSASSLCNKWTLSGFQDFQLTQEYMKIKPLGGEFLLWFICIVLMLSFFLNKVQCFSQGAVVHHEVNLTGSADDVTTPTSWPQRGGWAAADHTKSAHPACRFTRRWQIRGREPF